MQRYRKYERTLIFLLYKAALQVFPQGRLKVMHSLGKAIYCELDLGRALTAEDVAALEKEMRRMQQEGAPIYEHTVKCSDVLRHCQYEHDERESHRLETVDLEYITVYQCGDTIDYYFGPLLQNIKELTCFGLQHYASGFLLRLPEPENMEELPEYQEIPKFARVFLEAEEWSRILQCQYVSDLNTYIEKGRIEEIVDMAEALQEKKLASTADFIAGQKPKIKLVLVSGPSSAGKTTFCRRLLTQMKVNGMRPIMISLDDYFHEWRDTPKNEAGEYDFESLDAMDIELLNQQLNDLLAGKSVRLSRFDFKTGQRLFDKELTSVEQGQPIIVEGLHALNDRLTYTIPRYEKAKIYLGALTQIRINDRNRISTTDTRLLRRMVRDSQFRNKDSEETLKMWRSVRKGEEENIFPFQEDADIVFNTALAYELCVLKKYALPLLSKVRPSSPYYIEARRLLLFLMPFKILEEDIVPRNSLLREFIGMKK